MSKILIPTGMGQGGMHLNTHTEKLLKAVVDSFHNTVKAGATQVTDEVLTATADDKVWTFANDNVVAGTASFKTNEEAAIEESDIESIEYAYDNDVEKAQVTFKTSKTAPKATYKHVAVMPEITIGY